MLPVTLRTWRLSGAVPTFVLLVLAANGCATTGTGDGNAEEEGATSTVASPLSLKKVRKARKKRADDRFAHSVRLDGWWRDYDGAPWVGEPSRGSSEDRDAFGGVNVPAVGVSLNGRATCEADGVDDELNPEGVLGDYMTEEGFSGWVLFKARSASPHQPFAPYLEPAFFGDASGSVGVVFSDAGFGLHRATDFSGWKQVHVPAPVGEWHLGTFRWNAGKTKLEVGLDGPPTHSVHNLPVQISVEHWSRVVQMFRNFNGTTFLDGSVAETAISKKIFSDETFRETVRYVNRHYGLSLEQKSNEKGGRYPGCHAPDGHEFVASLVAPAAQYTERDGAKLHWFNGKYWLLGGWSPGSQPAWGGSLTTNEVWSSVDLVNWRLELPHAGNPPVSGEGARWRPRHAFGSVVHDGYLWVVGGDHLDLDANRSDVWRSNDGLTWERVLSAGPWGRKRLPIVGVYAGAIHVLGGEIDEPPAPGAATRQHYRSVDGKTWEQLPDMPFGRSAVYKAIEHCGLLLVIGGNAGSASERVLRNDTWAWDGSKWRQQSSSAPWSPRMWIDVAEYDGKIWALSGRSEVDQFLDEGGAWYSTDAGRTWLNSGVTWPATHADGVEATPADGIVMASGNKILDNVYRLKAKAVPASP